MSNVLPKRVLAGHEKQAIRVSPLVIEAAALDAAGIYARLVTRAEGLSSEEAAARLVEHGPNILARDQRPGFPLMLWRSILNPLVVLLAVLATVSFSTGDPRAGTVMVLMIVLSVGLRLYQEAKADSAAAKLKAMISVTATALRDGRPQEVPLAQLVPGDVIHLAAGDMIPGDVRLSAKDLFVSQGSLTGESFPVEKRAAETAAAAAPLELPTIAFLGTSVESGSATAVVVATGKETYLGGMAASLSGSRPRRPSIAASHGSPGCCLRFMAVMVPLVFVINGLTKGTLDPRRSFSRWPSQWA